MKIGLQKRIFARSLAAGDVYQDKIYGEYKKQLFEDLEGHVLEIGAGTGINLPYMPAGVRWIGIEPNTFMHRHIYDKAKDLNVEVSVRTDLAESLIDPDDSLDAVISTLVLCSVANPLVVFSEILRVLKPGGRFVFIEHIAAKPDSRLRKAQRAIRPVWRSLADGCHVDREMDRIIGNAGFSSTEIRHFDAPVPFTAKVIKPHIMGWGVK